MIVQFSWFLTVETKWQRYRAQLERSKRDRPRRGYQSVSEAARKRAAEQWAGSQGPASATRRIDPVTGEIIEIIPMKRW